MMVSTNANQAFLRQQAPSGLGRFISRHPLLGKVAVYTAIPAVLLFTARDAFTAQKDATPADSSKKAPALLVPLNLGSATRTPPFAYLEPSQVVYYGRFIGDSAYQSLSMVWIGNGNLQLSVQHEAVTQGRNSTATNGLAVKYSFTGFGGTVTAASRTGVTKDQAGKTTSTMDGAVSASSPSGIPIIATVRFGTNDNSQSVSTGNEQVAFSFQRKENAKTGKSAAIGTDWKETYSVALSQQFYASCENTMSNGSKTFIVGTRFFTPWGNGELDYFFDAARPLNGDIAFRITVSY